MLADEISIENFHKVTKNTRPFNEGMIMHHEGAIKMAQKVTGSTNKEVAALAAAIIEAQEKELAFMKELIKFY